MYFHIRSHNEAILGARLSININMVLVATFVAVYTYVRPIVSTSILGLGVSNLFQVLKWSSKMAAITYGYICHGWLQMSKYSNKTQWKLQTIPQTTIAGSERESILATTLPQNLKM